MDQLEQTMRKTIVINQAVTASHQCGCGSVEHHREHRGEQAAEHECCGTSERAAAYEHQDCTCAGHADAETPPRPDHVGGHS
jgi:hypothetical protein